MFPGLHHGAAERHCGQDAGPQPPVSLKATRTPRGAHGALCSGRLYPRARVGHRGMHRAVEHGRRLTAAGTLETGGALSPYKNTFLCKRHPKCSYREDARRTRQGAALTIRGKVRTLNRGSVSRPPTLPSWWVPAPLGAHTCAVCVCLPSTGVPWELHTFVSSILEASFLWGRGVLQLPSICRASL